MSFKENIEFNSIFVRKRNNKFCVIGQYIGDDDKEKQKTLASFTSKEDAENEKIKIKAAILENRFITSPDATLYDRFMEYYDDPLKNLAPTTVYRSKEYGKTYKKLLNIKLKDLNINSYKKILKKIYGQQHLKESSKNLIISMISSVVRECERNKEIELITPYVQAKRKTATAIEKLAKEDERFYLTKDEVSKLLNYKPDGALEEAGMLCIYTYLETGVRFGEMAGLKWESVDFKKKQIKIKNNLQKDLSKNVFIDLPAKGRRNRTISVSDILLEKYKLELERQQELVRMGLLKELTYVHLNSRLRPLTEKTADNYVKRIMRKSGVDPIRMHALRHTHASILLSNKVPVLVVSKRLGHSTTAMTMNIYAHVLEEDAVAAAGLIDDFIVSE